MTGAEALEIVRRANASTIGPWFDLQQFIDARHHIRRLHLVDWPLEFLELSYVYRPADRYCWSKLGPNAYRPQLRNLPQLRIDDQDGSVSP